MVDETTRTTGAEAMVHMLEAHGVEHIFGLCGDTTIPFYDAMHRLDHGINHILTRDERHAAYMADAYARVTGKVGVCEGPSGGGARCEREGNGSCHRARLPVRRTPRYYQPLLRRRSPASRGCWNLLDPDPQHHGRHHGAVFTAGRHGDRPGPVLSMASRNPTG